MLFQAVYFCIQNVQRKVGAIIFLVKNFLDLRTLEALENFRPKNFRTLKIFLNLVVQVNVGDRRTKYFP